MSSPRVVLLSLVIATSLMADTAGAAVKSVPGVRASITADSTTLYLDLGPRARYASTWVDPRTYALDITGASSALRPENRMMSSPVVSAYRVFGYDGSDGRPHVRVELSLKADAKVDADEKAGVIAVRVRNEGVMPAASKPAPADRQRQAAEPQSAPAVSQPESKSSDTRADVSASKRATSVHEVQVAKLEGTAALEVQILGNGALEYRTLRLTNPERVVVDISNATNRIRQKQLSVNTRPLRDVRIGQLSQSPLVTRVVMDLDGVTAFQTRRQANSVIVTLGNSAPNNTEEKKNIPVGSPELAPEKLNVTKQSETITTPVPPVEDLQASAASTSSPSPDATLPSEIVPAPQTAQVLPQVAEPEWTTPAAVMEHNAPSAEAVPAIADVQTNPEIAKTETATVAMSSAPVATVPIPTVEEAKETAPIAPATVEASAQQPAPVMSVKEVQAAPSPAPTSHVAVPIVLASLAANAEPMADATMDPAIARGPQGDAAWHISESSIAPSAINTTPAATLVASSAPVRPVASPVSQKTTRSVSAEKLIADRSQRPAATLLAQETAPPTQPAPGGAAPVAHTSYSGEPISVNLKDVDLKDFFRLIHEISGLNIVLDPTVAGQVTIVLDEVPWDQAMDVVMRNNGLGKEVEGNVVRIAKLDTLNSEQEARRKLSDSVLKAAPMITVPRTLSYAKANDLIAILKKFLTERGDIVADNRTNTLLITDIPERITQVEALIKTLDQKSLQVEIEARVVSASRSFARDIGTQLAASGLTGNVILGGAGAVGTSPINRAIPPPLFVGAAPSPPAPGQAPSPANLPQPLATNLAASGATSGLSFLLTRGSTVALDAIITAAESRGIGKLLSRPKIITQNNVEAIVKQGVKIPIQTTINNTVSVQYVDVVLRLTVTPQITAEGTIFLKTDIENTSIDPGIATTPGQFGLDTQSAQTQVLVSNGGTVFFGGVVQNINRVNQQEVPLLGSIPLIGNMFKHKSTTSTTNELLFFITPRIVQS